MSEKRKIPTLLQSILTYDKSLTRVLCEISDQFPVTKSIRLNGKALEYSCHGILWLTVWLLFVWLVWMPSLFQMQVNFFMGLILDITFVALIKAITRRRRPVGNKNDSLVIGPDKYSFPSGHVSRACLIVYFFMKLYPISWIFYPPMLAWCVSVSYSRILLRRHHVLDVLGGILLGLAEGILLSFIWLSRDIAFYIISWVTDEKFEGAEYHV